MSIWRLLCSARFWVAVLLELLLVTAVNAIGALLVVWGLVSAESAWYIHCAAWVLAAFGAGRFVSVDLVGDGLIAGSIVSLAGYCAVAITALIIGGGELSDSWISCGLAALSGAMVSGVMRPRKKRRKKKVNRVTVGKNKR